MAKLGDGEQWRGAAALGGVTVALAATVGALLRDSLPATWPVVGPTVTFLRDHTDARFVVLAPLGLVVIALLVASTNWRAASLRLTVLVAVGLLVAVVASVGRNVQRLEPTDAAAAELTALAEAVDSLAAPAAAVPAQREQALSTALADLSTAITAADGSEGAPPGLVSAARELVTAANDGDGPRVTNASAAFARATPANPPPVLVALSEALGTAVQAYTTEAEPPPNPQAVDDAIARACRAVNEAAPDDPCTIRRGSGADAAVADQVPVALAVVRLELARYRQAVLGRDEDATAVEDARKALTAARAATPQTEPPELGMLDAVRVGAEHVLSGARRGAVRGLGTTVEPAVWALLAALAVAFWRHVERSSGRQLPGPVTVDLQPFAGFSPDTSELQKATFRAALLRNISEPTAVPGAVALQSLTDLVEIALPAAGLPTRVLTALKSAVQAPVGYAVTGAVMPAGADGTGAAQVMVRVADRSGRRAETVSVVSAASAAEACRAAGYWAAAVVLERSRRIPRWARWSSASSKALAAFDDTGRVGGAAPSSAELAAAAAHAPDSGVLLHRWADSCDLDGARMQALSLYARAVAAHPRYPAARYRLAVSVSMLARSPQLWAGAGSSERVRVAGQLERACRAMGLDAVATKARALASVQVPDEPPRDLGERLKQVAVELFADVVAKSSYLSIPAHALRASERDHFWPAGAAKLGRDGTWARRRLLAQSALLGTGDTTYLDTVTKRAARPGSFWQLSYNLACYCATYVDDAGTPGSRPEEALTWLERALERPGAVQMAGGWLSTDPDLESLHGNPRFEWVLSQVDDTRTVVASDA